MLKALLILVMQLILVPVSTLRMTFVVKGQKSAAALLGVLEAFIYLISLGIVFSDLSNIYNMVGYGIGYGGGIYLGGLLEEKLAIGYRALNISLMEKNDQLIDRLRREGFGVTVFEGLGMGDVKRCRLDVIAKRTREKELMKILEKEDPKAFVVAYEPVGFKGGYLIKSMKKYKKNTPNV